jgi:hypothetical protein
MPGGIDDGDGSPINLLAQDAVLTNATPEWGDDHERFSDFRRQAANSTFDVLSIRQPRRPNSSPLDTSST